MNIQLVDLKTQYLKIKNEINEAVLNVIENTAFINGPQVKSFQQNLESYLNVNHVIPCANGTDALQIAMMALNLQPGDEVITPSFTYIATAEVIALLKLKPVFVDVDTDTFTIDPTKLKSLITPKTKAIVPVHLYGQCANMEAILEVANEYNLFVIEDTAQAIGTDYTFSDGTKRKAGTMGTIGTTSFFPSKNLGCYGDGGALFTNSDELAAKLRMVANHGQKQRYYHDEIGVNSRLDTIQAAVLDVKLKYFNDYIAARQHAADFYTSEFEAIPQITPPFISNYSDHTYHQYTIKLENKEQRDGLQKHLNDLDIPCNIYYPLPVHKQKGFLNYGFEKTDLSNTDYLTDVVLSLPMHTELTNEQLTHITNSVKEYFN